MRQKLDLPNIYLAPIYNQIRISRYGADKQDIQEAVQSIFNLPTLPRPDDAADGMATAYAAQCGHRSNIK